MGDLVRSEDAASPAQLHATFNAAVDRANLDHADALASPLTITLGDEFQGLVRNLATAAKIVRELRWSLLEQDVPCRFAIGRVALATPVNPERAWNMMGPGLAETRQRLQDKRDPNAYRFSLPGDPVAQRLLDAVGLALTAIETDWTGRQRDVAIDSLRSGARGQALVRPSGVSAGVFYKIRRAARFDLYQAQWSAVLDSLAEMDAGSA
jgi:hypothetical protein